MNEYLVHQYLREYEEFAVNNYSNGLEAFERCKASLIAGEGLCRGELKFLQAIRLKNGPFPPRLSEIKDLLRTVEAPIHREATEEEKEFWINFFSRSNKTS